MSEPDIRPLPITLEEIGREWLTAALRTRAHDVTVNNVQIVDIKRGTCTKIRLRLELDEAAQRAGIPETVILKGGFEPHSRDLHFMHEHEVRGYRDLIPELKLRTPACYFADYDAERRQGIVIIEDLVPRGVTFCNPLEPQTQDQVARRLVDLAAFHARTWNSPDFLPEGRWHWLNDMAVSSRIYAEQYLQPLEWRRFIEAPRGAAASVRFHDSHWMAETLDRMVALSSRLPHAVIHGDTHLGNLYIDADGSPGFFDPVPHRAPPMMEVTYHIGCALDPADRRRWERPLVGHYLDELGRNGVDPPAFDDGMRQYGVFLAQGYWIFLINESFFQLEAVNTAYTARFSAAMLDNDTIGLLEAIN